MRQSNMELLRIIAMFLVLVVHSDFFSLGAPTHEELIVSPLPSVTRLFFESLSVICVNIFVLLSGWFGIHFSYKGLFKLLFQVFFFKFGVYLGCVLFGVTNFTISGLLHCMLLDHLGWFIKAYLLLYLLSPVLNSFTYSASKHQCQIVLISFFAFQTIFGFLFDGSVSYINGGYSIVSFIGLYLLSQYVHRYGLGLHIVEKISFLTRLFAFLILLNTAFLAVAKSLDLNYLFDILWTYTNPLVIMSALALLMIFSKCSFQSKMINKIASYSFAVYLFHTHSIVLDNCFKPQIQTIYNIYDGIYCILLIFLVLVAFYVIATLVDLLREFCWLRISSFL